MPGSHTVEDSASPRHSRRRMRGASRDAGPFTPCVAAPPRAAPARAACSGSPRSRLLSSAIRTGSSGSGASPVSSSSSVAASEAWCVAASCRDCRTAAELGTRFRPGTKGQPRRRILGPGRPRTKRGQTPFGACERDRAETSQSASGFGLQWGTRCRTLTTAPSRAAE